MSRFTVFLRRAGIGFGSLVVVLGVTAAVRYVSCYLLPPLPPRALPEPAPNGYQTLLTATRLLVKEKDGIQTVPEKRDKFQPLAGRQKLLAANAASIAKLREALGQEWLAQEWLLDDDKNLEELSAFREEARMLAFAAQTEADQGDSSAAVRAGVDAIALGIRLPRGGMLTTGLTGLACEAIGEKALWRILDQLDAPTARQTILRLQMLEPKRIPLAAILAEEGRSNRAVTQQAFTGGQVKLWKDLDWVGGTNERIKLKIFWDGPKTVITHLDAWLATVAAESEKPWTATRMTVPRNGDTLFEILAPVFIPALFKWAHTRAYRTLLMTSLALRAYRLEKGNDAPSLDALVQAGYLSSVPSDPFSPTRAPLCYQNGKLWSVGPDAKDDSGKPIASKYGYVNVDQTGDIVAGVNTWSNKGRGKS